MDRREMEKLMDKYKAEMLEFSKRNNISGYPNAEDQPADERERLQNEAREENRQFERDRSDRRVSY